MPLKILIRVMGAGIQPLMQFLGLRIDGHAYLMKSCHIEAVLPVPLVHLVAMTQLNLL